MRGSIAVLPILALLVVALLGASPAAAQADGREQLHVDIPEGMSEIHRETSPQVVVVEHVPQGQTVDGWVDKVTVLIFAPNAFASLDAKLRQMTTTLTTACLVPPRIYEPVRFDDGDFPTAVLSVACGKGKRTGDAGVFIAKMIFGRQGLYEVQRAWRFPAVPSSADVPLTQAMVESAKTLMTSAYVCGGPAARAC